MRNVCADVGLLVALKVIPANEDYATEAVDDRRHIAGWRIIWLLWAPGATEPVGQVLP